ncbi:B12-binding domain-containing radical SAM protein [Candidatus Latescibacterota bacterium]
MLKVALVNARIEPRQHVPMGLLYLAAYVENICDLVIFDSETDDMVLQDIIDFQPDIIGITSMTQNFWRAKEIINVLKAGCNSKIIVGGIHATVASSEVLSETGADAVCVGEGEFTFKEYIEANIAGNGYENIKGLISKDNKTLQPRELIKDLDSLPFPAYHLMPKADLYLMPIGTRGALLKEKRVDVMTGRGCPANCIYCGSKAIFGRKVRRRSVDSVIKEIELRISQFGNVSFLFGDDTFTNNKPWVMEFCKRIKEFKVSWACQTRGDRITEEIAKALKESGCRHIDIGVESGSPTILEILKKGVKREQYIETFRILRKYKIKTGATFILGTPGETEELLEETKDLIRIIKPNFSLFFYLSPYPGTELFEMVEVRNYTGLGVQETAVLENENISRERYIQIRNELVSMTQWRNMANYVSLRTIIGLLHLVNIRRIRIIASTFWKKNIFDAMFAFLQDCRKEAELDKE